VCTVATLSAVNFVCSLEKALVSLSGRRLGLESTLILFYILRKFIITNIVIAAFKRKYTRLGQPTLPHGHNHLHRLSFRSACISCWLLGSGSWLFRVELDERKCQAIKLLFLSSVTLPFSIRLIFSDN